MNTEILIDKLTKAISHRYRKDKTAPGLVVSALKEGYYCSVVRYTEPIAKNKIVVCKAKANFLRDALKDLTDQFLKIGDGSVDPVQDLNNYFLRANHNK